MFGAPYPPLSLLLLVGGPRWCAETCGYAQLIAMTAGRALMASTATAGR